MEEAKLSLKQMVEDAKEEMRYILPGFMKKVTDGTHTIEVESPGVLERSGFRIESD